MLPHKQPSEVDYKARFGVLAADNILRSPSARHGTPLTILNRTHLDELSFAFFVGWLYLGVFNVKKKKLRAAIVPMESSQSLVVFWESGTKLAPPTRSNGLLVDEEYFTCPLDQAAGKPLTDAERQLCPVLNRLRYNLSHCTTHPSLLTLPSEADACCASVKRDLWQYLRATVVGDNDRYGAMLGGVVVPTNLDPALLKRFATGLDGNTQDMGKVFEETLLWYAMAAAPSIRIGLPHFEFTEPFLSNEIDFALCDTGGLTLSATPDWATACKSYSLCVYELTVGHRGDGEQEQDHTSADRQEGSDHPKNKLINHLALRSTGFQIAHFHYLSILGSSNQAPSTARALRGTDGFNYWVLQEEVPDVEERILNHFETPVPVATLRDWHRRIVEQVESAARTFQTALGSPADSPAAQPHQPQILPAIHQTALPLQNGGVLRWFGLQLARLGLWFQRLGERFGAKA